MSFVAYRIPACPRENGGHTGQIGRTADLHGDSRPQGCIQGRMQ